MTHHQVITGAPATHVPFDPSGIIFVILFVWSLWGLWIYLDERARGGPSNFFITLIAGPAAWLTAVWYLKHRRASAPKKPRRRQWQMSSEYWRN
jgi:hypothetical protein